MRVDRVTRISMLACVDIDAGVCYKINIIDQ